MQQTNSLHDDSVSTFTLPVITPYRLDLTTTILRRTTTNLVDIVDDEGGYRRGCVFPGSSSATTVHVVQVDAAKLRVTVNGPAQTHAAAVAMVERMLGCKCDIQPFLNSAASISWLNVLAQRMAGVHPPRYPTLWEACVNAVVFQQVSITAASAILARILRTHVTPFVSDDVTMYPFFGVAEFLTFDVDDLRAAGLSAAKTATLQRIAEKVVQGELNERHLQTLPTEEIVRMLCTIKGIGPWTASLILLRGFGRLDVFPQNDSGAARSLLLLTQDDDPVQDAVNVLSPQQGMLYYHLLLAKLDAAGLVRV